MRTAAGHGLRTIFCTSLHYIAPLLLSLIILQGCVPMGEGTSSGFNIISVSQEITMGRQLSQQVERKFPLYRNREAHLYVTHLGNRLVRAYGGPSMFDFIFKVVDDKEVNAFNIPGGYVYIHRGLITKSGNEAELASVIAHEIGHAVARHSTQMLSTQLGVSMLLSMVLGQNPSQLHQIAANLFTSAGILAYTRSMEREADRLAIYIMYQAGYDPRASITFMDRLLEMKKREPHALEKLFSSHPPTSERITNAEAEIGGLTLRRGMFLNTSRFNRIKKVLEADPYPDKRNLRRY